MVFNQSVLFCIFSIIIQFQNGYLGIIPYFLDQGIGQDASKKQMFSVHKGDHITICTLNKKVDALAYFYGRQKMQLIIGSFQDIL
jgi:hypothetical protein